MTVLLQSVTLDTPQGPIVHYKTPNIIGAKTVFLLHGLSANHTTWIPLIEALFNAGYMVIAPDMRGHGNSDKSINRSRYSMQQLARDIEYIVKHENLASAVFVGYSFGGSVIIEYGVEHPSFVDSLVLISANHVNPFAYRWYGIIARYLAFVLVLAGYLLIPVGPRSFTTYDPTKPGGYWQSVWRGLMTMPLSVNAWLVATGLTMDMRSRLSRIVAPVLIVRAKDDPFFTSTEADIMLGVLQNANLVTLQTGHFIATEEIAITTKLVLDFLHTTSANT